MATRRGFLTGLLAASVTPLPSWADAGNPRYLTAALHRSGDYRLCGLSAMGEILFTLPLPARGHAAAAHPTKPQAIAFARRPGSFALVIDCARGQIAAELTAPPMRHFYGHGVFSQDGKRLYTTENDLETREGRIGIWDTDRFSRIGDIASGGIGPHDLRRIPGSDQLVVANGGIETHPDSGRAKLNLPTMAPNLTVLSPDGRLKDRFDMPRDMRRNSLRHLAVRRDGLMAAAMQWQADPADAPPLLLLYQNGSVRFLHPGPDIHPQFAGYAGSVAFSGNGQEVAITSPRGGILCAFDVANGTPSRLLRKADVCGLAPSPGGFAYSTGTGHFASTQVGQGARRYVNYHFDNHMIAI